MARKIEYHSLISEAARLSTAAAKIRRVADDIGKPANLRLFRVVDVSKATVPEHTRRAHKRIIPMSSAYRARLKTQVYTPRIEQFPVCATIRKCTAIPGNVRQKLIAAILRLAKENGVGTPDGVSTTALSVIVAFTWTNTRPSFPALSRSQVHALWDHVYGTTQNARDWDDSLNEMILTEFRPPKKAGRK